jgi:dipeptidyl aminopeptidase/acylaminoacyl peptidase
MSRAHLPIVSIVVAAVCAVMPTSANEVFTPDHVARLWAVTSAHMSPDGQHIAYVLSVPRRPFEDEDGPAWAELYLVGPDGRSRPYVTGEVNVGSVKWTPDGKGIAFLAERGSDKHGSLYIIPVDGGEARKVLSHKTSMSAYDFSPDGQRVAFLARDKEPKEKKKLSKKGFDQEIFEEDLRFVRVWIGKPDDEDAKPRRLDLPGSASELYWSPDGTRLVVALAPTPLIDDYYMKRKIHVFDVETGGIVSRIDNPGKIGRIAWSPDGKHLAVIAAADLHDPGLGRLTVAPAAGGPQLQAAQHRAYHDASPQRDAMESVRARLAQRHRRHRLAQPLVRYASDPGRDRIRHSVDTERAVTYETAAGRKGSPVVFTERRMNAAIERKPWRWAPRRSWGCAERQALLAWRVRTDCVGR